MKDDFCDGKTSNVVSLPQQLSGPLHVVDLGGMTHRHMNEIGILTFLESSIVGIESSLSLGETTYTAQATLSAYYICFVC